MSSQAEEGKSDAELYARELLSVAALEVKSIATGGFKTAQLGCGS